MPITSRFVVRSSTAFLAVAILALLGIIGMTIWLNQRAQIYFDDVIEARDIRGSAVELRDAMRTAESSQRGFMLTGNEIYLAPFDGAKVAAQRHLEALDRKLAPNGAPNPMLKRLTELVGEKLAEMDQSVALKKDGKDAEVLALIRTNRGKTLMDNANVFLYGVILAADERLTAGVAEQRANTAWLRWWSAIGGVSIILLVGGMVVTVMRYTYELAQARDEVRALNTGLEQRVERRTADLARARDRAEVLLAEVNHRVANSLTLVASLVNLQSRSVQDQAAKDALAETQGRIQAISLVHKRLYSAGDVKVVDLREYLSILLEHLETAMRAEGHTASLKSDIAPLKLRTDASVSLGIVVTEWVTNAFKYAYPDRHGEIRVTLRSRPDGRAELGVEDDGVGRKPGAAAKGTGLGARIVGAMATSIRAEIHEQAREPGSAYRLVFAPDAESGGDPA